MLLKRVAQLVCIFLIATGVSIGQEGNRYTKNGISFNYPTGWAMSERQKSEGDEIALSNNDADAQITVIAVNKKVDTKDPADARKRVFEPWLKTLELMYRNASIGFTTVEEKSDAAGVPVDGVRLKLDYGGMPGTVKAFWILKDKRFLIVYMIRPDAKAEVADKGWDKLRESLRVEAISK